MQVWPTRPSRQMVSLPSVPSPELGVLLTSRARSALLRVVVNLGTETQEAGVASKLFGMLSDSITHNDVECKRRVDMGCIEILL